MTENHLTHAKHENPKTQGLHGIGASGIFHIIFSFYLHFTTYFIWSHGALVKDKLFFQSYECPWVYQKFLTLKV